MQFDEILALLRANPSSTDWGHVELANVWTSYCLADINLRSEFQIVWEQGKPFMQITLYYAATVLLSFSIPTVGANVSRDSIAELLNKTTEQLSEGRSS